ncbi:hypothetical protein V9T40_003105 [Parthenolecanium corni]|uniref:Uncharacterized protein n=1 Tax=Parthenolecanium corni TaxID=536013 RepID=A0AAN9TUE3_9HEMI
MLPLKPGLLIFCVAIAILHPSWTQKIQTTRTALHVARSLDPDSMETVPVKTRAGDLTTIIVKKRQGKSSNITEPDTNSTNYVLLSSSNVSTDDTANRTRQSSKIEQIIAIPYSEYNASSHISASASQTASQNRTDRSNLRVPEPVYVSSSMVLVKNELNSPTKKGRSLVKMDADGIPVVTGVRVPDDDSDRQVWRNARVINGILVPYDKADKDIITKSKPSRKPSTMKPSDDMWTKIGTVNKKPTKLSPAVQIMKQESWNDPKWDLFKRPATLKPIVAHSTSEPQVLQTIETSDNADRSRPSYTQHPLGLWMPADTDENPEHKYVTDRILEYIRNINKEEMKRLSMQKFTVRDARMLSTVSPLQEQPQIQSRILHVPGASVFPNSAMYSASTQAPSRVSFEEGVRTPVLQYAHPELGVQSAKAEPTQGEIMDKKESSYYPEDIHADRGPFVFEPAAPAEQAETEAANNQRSHTAAPSYFQRPKKTLAYFYPEKQAYAPNKYYGKYPPIKDDYKLAEYPTIYYEDMDGRPFWIRFGDSLKEQVQTGIDKVTDLTRPVVEPLVEASQKISQNLGFSGNRDMSTIREKLGTVSTSSLILPAIGIVAGGAALGLGAVAVGR